MTLTLLRDEYIGKMYDAFIESLLWSEYDLTGEPMDTNYTMADIDQATREEIMSDCEGLFDSCWQVLYNLDPSQVGHDFEMTRNGHGCGFWDGDYSDLADSVLTAEAKVYGTLGLYVGDDGELYGHN